MSSSSKHAKEVALGQAARRNKNKPVPVVVPVPVGKYEYDSHRYLFDVKIPGIVGSIAIPVAVALIATGFLPPIAAVILVVGAYTVFNTFIARCYPRTISVDESSLTFESFGRKDVYRIDEIEKLSARENSRYLSAYIRINGGGLMRGRYFVGCGDMHDESGERAEALYMFFLRTEARLDPDNIRVRARRSSGVLDDKK